MARKSKYLSDGFKIKIKWKRLRGFTGKQKAVQKEWKERPLEIKREKGKV